VNRAALLLALALPLHAQSIAPAAIEAHMRFLADDLLEGRETGTRGFAIAAEYVRAQFAAAGLTTSTQPISFRTAAVVEQSLRAGTAEFVPRKDFVLYPSFTNASVDVTAPVVFAGFGVVAPEAGHDDYKTVDVRGKVVMVLTGAPSTWPSEQRAYYSGTALKQRVAAEHGAAGLLLVSSRTDERRVPFERIAGQAAQPSMRTLDANGLPADVTTLRFSGRISYAVATALLGGSGLDLETVLRDAEKDIARPAALSATVAARQTTRFAEAKSENVIGIVRGRDSRLRDQYVVASAHLDHLGNHDRTGKGGDTIFNGAQDNASGIACLIEIARALAKTPPKRSVVFVALTGEEKGELGSRYFARNPTVPKKSIVADVNMDMPLLLYPPASVIALGGEHSTLGPFAREAAALEKLDIIPDPLPEEVRFIRSDQFAFVQEGIPAIHLKLGGSSTPKVDANAATREWLRTIYHGVSDDMSQPINFEAGARYARTNLRLLRAIADSPKRVAWNRGDFFARLFAGR
jgi:hypothetical protein